MNIFKIIKDYKRKKNLENISIDKRLKTIDFSKEVNKLLGLSAKRSDEIDYLTLKNNLPQLFYTKKHIVYSYPIDKINSIQSSKSNLENYDSLYEFGKKVYEKEGWNETKCIKHLMLNFYNKRIFLKKYEWNQNVHWDNSGGSHHFACLYYLNKEKKLNYEFNAYLKLEYNISDIEIEEIKIIPAEVEELLKNFQIYLIPNNLTIKFAHFFKSDIKDDNEYNYILQFPSISSYKLRYLVLQKKVFKKLIRLINEEDELKRYFFDFNKVLKKALKI